MNFTEQLVNALTHSPFDTWGYVRQGDFEAICRDHALAVEAGAEVSDALSKYQLAGRGGVIVTCLNYSSYTGNNIHSAERARRAYLRLAYFVQNNWYEEIKQGFKNIIRELERKDLQYFCNSNLPEKALAIAAGLGNIGRNSLLIVKDPRTKKILGPACLIGVLSLPAISADVENYLHTQHNFFDAQRPAHQPNFFCKSCQLCVTSCPTHALPGDARVIRNLCISHHSARDRTVPAEVRAGWHNNLYGCDKCLRACPHFKLSEKIPQSTLGSIGEFVLAQDILETSEEELRQRYKKSALTLKWMDYQAFKRNARWARVLAHQL